MRLGDGQVVFLRQLIEGGFVGLADIGRDLIRGRGGLLVDFIQQVIGPKRVFHFVEGLGMSSFLVQDLDDVKSILGLRNTSWRDPRSLRPSSWPAPGCLPPFS